MPQFEYTAAALMIEPGAHPRAMMERLGHSSVTITLDTYGHLLPSLEESITDGLEDRLQAAQRIVARPQRDPNSVVPLRTEAESRL